MTAAPIVGAEARLRPALWFAKHGFHVLPVWSATPAGVCRCPRGKACDQPGKHPITPGGFHDATDDAARITTMLAAGSEPNYGLTLPAGCFALDVDGAAVALIAEMEARLGPLPPTLTNLTAHGRHIVLRWPAELPRPTGNLFGIVTRWGGSVGENAPDPRASGYIIGPGSVHPSGMAYAFASRVVEIAELPAAWAAVATPPRQTTLDDHGPGYRIPDAIGDGERYEAIVRYIASRYMRGIERDEMWAGVRDVLAPRMHPPLTEAELRARFDRAWHGTPERLGDPMPQPEPAETEPTIGTRTGRDLRHGDAPPQLAGAFLTAEGPTVLYARGGTGKGLLACWFALQLVRAGHVVMVVDFEGHEMEWGSRLRGLGLTDDELGRIHYRAPFGTDWTAPTGSLSAVADAIRDDAARLGVTYLVVDSYSVATSNGDTMGGEAAAREYFSGLARIGLPSLTIAHVRGDSGKFPERPFGSVFVHNLARETWAVERIGDDDPDAIDPDEIRFGPYVVALEVRNKKANARPKSAAQFVTFSFFADGTIEVATDGPAGRSVADLAADALADGPLTLAKITAAIKEDTGQVVGENALRSALVRHPRRFTQDTTGKRPHPWSLR